MELFFSESQFANSQCGVQDLAIFYIPIFSGLVALTVSVHLVDSGEFHVRFLVDLVEMAG